MRKCNTDALLQRSGTPDLDFDGRPLRDQVSHRKVQEASGHVGVTVCHRAAGRPTNSTCSSGPDFLEDRLRDSIRECHSPDSIWYVGTRDMKVKLAKRK